MTHEELIERVAEALCKSNALPYSQRSEWNKRPFREHARAVVRIIGEACAESAGVVEDYHRKEVAEADDNEVMMARYNAQLAAGVVKNRIQSLTQGNKTA